MGIDTKQSIGNHNPPQGTPQLALGQSLSFEISTEHPVPDAIAQRASFLYQFNQSPTLHHALLQDLIPQFMRIYAFRSTASLVRLVHNFLQEENAIFGV